MRVEELLRRARRGLARKLRAWAHRVEPPAPPLVTRWPLLTGTGAPTPVTGELSVVGVDLAEGEGEALRDLWVERGGYGRGEQEELPGLVSPVLERLHRRGGEQQREGLGPQGRAALERVLQEQAEQDLSHLYRPAPGGKSRASE